MMWRSVLGAALLAVSTISAPAADYTLKVASPTNNDSILKWMESFKSRVEAASDGQIAVELYPANQLGQIPATIEGLTFGTIEVSAPASSFFVNYDPRFEVFDVPGLFEDLAHAQRVLSDPAVLDHIESFGAEKGLHTIAAFPHGPLGLLSTKAVERTADLDGQKIRVAGPSVLNTRPLMALGASPISMPLGEVLPAMQNGVVDGFLAGLPVFTIGKFYDVATDLTVLPESYLIVTAVASQTFLDMIGPDLTEVVRSSARDALADANGWNLKAVEGAGGVWTSNAGRLIDLDDAESKSYLDAVAAALPAAYEENATLEAEVLFMQDAAKRLSAN